MKNLEILGVSIDDKDVVISLFGGPSNAAGTIRFLVTDTDSRGKLLREAEALMNGNVLVDLAVSVSTGKWRLIGKNREILGGMVPSKLSLNQTPWKPPSIYKEERPVIEDKGGLGWPEAWGDEE